VAKLANLKEVEIGDILATLPNVSSLDITRDFAAVKDDLFLVALGFEERCLWIPELIAKEGKYRSNKGIYLEYLTNQSDNDINRPNLLKAMESFSSSVQPMIGDSNDYSSQLRALLREITNNKSARVTFDISVCSSRLLVTTLTILFEFDINLRIVYSEAGIYHPTKEEYEADPDKWEKDEGLGLASGVSAVIPSPDHPGNRRDNLPECVIVFPTFKPERSRAIIAHVDQSLIVNPKDRVIWIIGDPHLPQDHWRTEVLKKINQIQAGAPLHEVSTFDYKKTLESMERLYKSLACKCHVNIAPLGSKLQCIGIVLFWHIRPEASIIYASPRKYNAIYSEGCKAMWRIDFGPLAEIQKVLNSVGEIRIQK